MAEYHKIKSLALTGGFLRDAKLDFHEGFNCIIGGRGSGKTTVLELIRYALDRTPPPHGDKERHYAFERLIQGNLVGGSVRLQIETRDGTSYTVARAIGEKPFITNENGAPIAFNIEKDTVFGIDIYSQNQIEEIADDPYFQLQLIDKFIHREVDDLERRLRYTTKDLEANASGILETRKLIDDLTETTRDLPDVLERIRGLDKGTDGSSELRKEHELKGLRADELTAVEAIRVLYSASVNRIENLTKELQQQVDDAFGDDLNASPNASLIQDVRSGAHEVIQDVVRGLQSLTDVLTAAQINLSAQHTEIAALHILQEKKYREILDKHEQERAKGIERARLERRHTDLKAQTKRLHEATAKLAELTGKRVELRATLSDLRDERYRLRHGVAEKLTTHLSPTIRVSVEPFGNLDEYRALLVQSMKGSRLHYATIVDRAVERIPPAELANLIQNEDRVTLERELEIDADRATRFLIQLKDKPEIFAIETVELHDRPIIELKDGQDYKDSASLSTGQKCTTILPILLMQSERPLLIDQPEDNLDNAFIYDTIVQSIGKVRGERQLIFVTHNPNIPVLGEAARVFCLRSTGRTATVAKVGSVDDVAPEIMTILEGGRAAFEARRKRYGQPLPS